MSQALKRSDLRSALDTLGAISECTRADGQLGRECVGAMRGLVASDLAHLSICNIATGHRVVVSDVTGAIPRREIETFDRHFHEHPLVRAHGRKPAVGTRRISDLLPAAQFRRTPLYNDYYRTIRIEHAMAVPIHVQGDELVSFVLNRSGRDFSDRDRACAEAIRPHLRHIFRLGRQIRDARAAWGMPPAGSAGTLEALTARERDVMAWLSGGKTDRDIAGILGISHRTVHKHLQRIYEKLGVETRTAAVARWASWASPSSPFASPRPASARTPRA